MYCDCVLSQTGWSSGYVPVLVVSLIFVVSAMAVLVGGWRQAGAGDVEAPARRMLDLEE